MNKIDEFALKQIILYLDGESLVLQMVDPKNSDELNELKKLDKKGLIKFQIIDASARFIAHKGILQKLINDLSSCNSAFSEIVDRTQGSHSLVQIYASKIWLRKSELTPVQFEQLVRKENLILENLQK